MTLLKRFLTGKNLSTQVALSGLRLLGVSAFIAWSVSTMAQSRLSLEARSDGSGMLIRWELSPDAPLGIYQLERSQDLVNWELVFQLDLRPQSLNEAVTEYHDREVHPLSFYRLVQGGAVIASVVAATDGADLYGFSSEFQQALQALGEISVEEFLARYDSPDAFVETLSYDPASKEFMDSFSPPVGQERSDPFFGEVIPPVKGGLELNDEELGVLKEHGFVVSGRHGSFSYTDSFYEIFVRDLPVFVSLDPVLHAWNQAYRNILEETEEHFLAPQIRDMIDEMRN